MLQLKTTQVLTFVKNSSISEKFGSLSQHSWDHLSCKVRVSHDGYDIHHCVQVCGQTHFITEKSVGTRKFYYKLLEWVDCKLLRKYNSGVTHKTRTYHVYEIKFVRDHWSTFLVLERAVDDCSWKIIDICRIHCQLQVRRFTQFGIEKYVVVKSFLSGLCVKVDFKLFSEFKVEAE